MTPGSHPIEFLPELALGVLPEAEAAPIRRHLEQCDACREEFAELERVASLLPLAAEGPGPAPATREALLLRARAEAPRRPVPFPAARRWVAGIAAAFLLLAAGALGGWLLARSDGGEVPAADLAARDTLLAAAARGEAVRASGSGSTGVRADVLLAPGAGLAAAALEALPPAPAGHVYQAWLIEGTTPRPAGLLEGAGLLLLAPGGDLRTFTAFALTLEPAGGSPAPTTDPLVVVPFALAARR